MGRAEKARRPLRLFRQAQVEELDKAVAANHHIFRLDIAAEDVSRVEKLEGQEKLRGHASSLLLFELFFMERLVKVQAVDVLEDKVPIRLVFE